MKGRIIRKIEEEELPYKLKKHNKIAIFMNIRGRHRYMKGRPQKYKYNGLDTKIKYYDQYGIYYNLPLYTPHIKYILFHPKG